jgi:hypothetical protein
MKKVFFAVVIKCNKKEFIKLNKYCYHSWYYGGCARLDITKEEYEILKLEYKIISACNCSDLI